VLDHETVRLLAKGDLLIVKIALADQHPPPNADLKKIIAPLLKDVPSFAYAD
jgi:hypothetical protein